MILKVVVDDHVITSYSIHYTKLYDADIGYQVMVDLRRLGVLHVDGDVALAAAVDLAAGGGDMYTVGHLFLDELVVQFIHQSLHNTRGVGAGDVAVQPALGVGQHGHGVAGSANDEAGIGQRLDQRLYLGLVGYSYNFV